MKISFCLIVLLTASAVWGQEISYSSGPPFYVPVNSDPVSLDMNQDATADAIFSGEWLITDDVPPSESSIICYVSGANAAQLLTTNGYAQILSAGEVIGDLTDWSAETILLTAENFHLRANTSSGWLGPFGAKGKGYLGIQFSAVDGIHYGWIQVRLPGINELSPLVMDWAYETIPNKPIAAGEKPVYFEATFNGMNEVPPNKSTHSGNGTFVLEGGVLNYNLKLEGSFAPNSAGIFGPANPSINSGHLIADLGNAQMVFQSSPPPIGNVPFTPATTELNRPTPFLPPPSLVVYDGQINLSSNQVAELLAERLYVNFKSSTFPRGELRGEIFPTTPIQFSATLSGRDEIPRNKSAHRGEAAFTLAGNSLSYELALDNFTFTSVGIYTSPFAFPNPFNLVSKLDITFGVVIPGSFPEASDLTVGFPGQVLYDGQSTLNLMDKQVYQLMRGELYINVLMSRFRFGEIGGQILPAE